MKRIATIALVALIAVIGFASCDFLVAVTMSVTGKAVNVLAEVSTTDEYWKGQSATGTAVTLEGARITLTSLKENDSTSYTATVNSSGEWVVTGISSGKYRITGLQDGWTIIPMDVEISGFLSEVSADVLAYPTPSGDPIMLIVRWDNELIDVDSYLVIDSDSDLSTSNSEDTVSFSDTESDFPVAGAVTLDRDVKFETATSTSLNGYPVETIRITANPFDSGDLYDGQLRYYLQSYSYLSGTSQQTTNTTLTGDPTATYTGRAEATVYVMQGTDNYGTWAMPIDTAEKTLGVIKIDVVGNGTSTIYTIKSFGNEGDTPKSLGIVPVVVDSIR